MSVIYIAVLLVAIWLVIEILSIVFKITGLELNKARFQVISILTHTGFTTRESELIAQHPLRRKLASILMLLSYVAQASLITLIYNMISQDEKQIINVGILLAAITVIFLVVTRNKYVSSKFDKIIEKFIAKRIMKQTEKRSIDQVLKISPEYAVYEILVDSESSLSNTTLKEAKLNDMYIHVLKIDRGSSTIDFPKADFLIQPGDVLIVYGKIKSIKDLALQNK
ncbi:MAG: TrkA C-terminal domain-containing protein [Eubacteriales bacterium]|nr:TrkA C-terminal domain-containing protein [Eubacteriales bacterium]